MMKWTPKSPQKQSNNEVIVRKAIECDYNDVINIDHDIYGGRDYLHDKYHDILENSHMHAVICEASDQTIVGFSAGHVVDAGSTIVLEAGRVKKSSRGQGLTRLMREAIQTHYCTRGLPILQELLVTEGSHLARTKHSFLNEYEEIQQRKMLHFMFNKEDMSLKGLEAPAGGDIQLLDLTKEENFHAALSCLTGVPAFTFIISYMPLTFTTCNKDVILPKNGLGFATLLPKTSFLPGSTTDAVRAERQIILSFGNYFPCQLGLRYTIDLYNMCTDCHNPVIELHLKRHLREAVSRAGVKDLSLGVITTDQRGHTEHIRKYLTSLSLREDLRFPSHVHLYRRKMSLKQ